MASPLLPPVFVNGVEIPAEAIASEAQNHPAPPGKPGLAWRAAAQALALREACLQAARASGGKVQSRETAPGLWETEDEALIRAFLESRITPAEPDDAQLRQTYAATPDRFRAPDLWEAAHILIAAPPEDRKARSTAKAVADELVAQLIGNPGRFAELARQHSACSSAKSGGFLGQIGPGDTLPEFETALRDLQPGQIAAAPVQTRFGFHIIRLDAHAKGAVLPFEAVLPRLRDAARKVAWTAAAKAAAAQIMAEAEIAGLTREEVPA